MLWATTSNAAITATIDTDEHLTMPVPHRYIHGVIPDDAKFQLALPDNWNGKLAIFSRGFSGTELSTGSFKTTALEKGYAFAASDEGWNRATIANRPQDTYYESRQRIWELTLYAKQVLMAHYKKEASRTLMMGGSNGGHHTKWMVESFPDLYDGGIAGYGFNSLGYLHDSMPRFDETFNPGGGLLTDNELKLWDPSKSPKYVQNELRKLDLSGDLKRPVIIMHGKADPIVSPGEAEGYLTLVERRLGRERARNVLAVYYIPGMGHGGTEYNNLIGQQIDALEQWIDYRESGGKKGAPAPESLGGYPREKPNR